jgi:NADH-quinone oxidoreductase subunit C
MADTDSGTTATEEAEAPPRDEQREAVLAGFAEVLGDDLVGSHIAVGRQLWVRVTRDAWFTAAEAAKGRLGFHFFDWLSAIDWMPSPWGRYEDAAGIDVGIPQFDPNAPMETGVAGGDTRFQVMCRLTNIRRHAEPHLNVILKADLPTDDLRIASLVSLYAGANWHERECWEMFGITFDGHPSLRHLYLPGEFEGHPLRKDFPLLARLVKPWPGIVDVEPMPGGADEPAEGDAVATEGEAD